MAAGSVDARRAHDAAPSNNTHSIPNGAGHTHPLVPIHTCPPPHYLPPPAPRTGGFIYLHVQSARQELWTVVQWQDGSGDWHDVEGWQGTLDDIQNEIGYKVWWVAKSGLGTGPFRWLVYQSKGGRLLATSEPFYLPGFKGGTVMVEVSPGP